MASPKDAVDSKSPVLKNETISKPDDIKPDVVVTSDLGPPPRPALANSSDYFSTSHRDLSSEANPFEYSFANGSNGAASNGTTPGGTKLPSVAALTSPVNIGLGGSINTPGSQFWGGLRSGPLSPAMLSGPQKEAGDDYFGVGGGHHLRGGFPTPNESGMRSGLTPGGGGSMFPDAPSPNTAALFQNLSNGAATPGAIEFQRTAMNIAERNRLAGGRGPQHNVTSQPQNMQSNMDVKPPQNFDQHDATDAANGLFLLAQARNGPQPTNHYTMANQNPVHAHPQAMNMQMGGQSADTSPTMGHRNGRSISSQSGRGASVASNDYEDETSQQSRPNTRGKGKRGTQDSQNAGQKKGANGTAKGHASKKSKGNNGRALSEPPSDDEPPREKLDLTKEEYNANGKKMTDEEKRKNFLERNRVAALKCRQRKKQWLANLQSKVELYTAENDNLTVAAQQLREENVRLKTILLAHKDCPVSQQQGLGGMAMHQLIEGQQTFGGPMNPYNMAANMQQQQQQTQQNGIYGQGQPTNSGMQRRDS